MKITLHGAAGDVTGSAYLLETDRARVLVDFEQHPNRPAHDIRPMMYLAPTCDHRIVDGRETVLFLRRIKEIIETPARMLLEI